MIDAIKKTLLAGVGVTVVTKDKIEAALSEYVAKGKVSADEARATAHRIAEEGRREWETTSAELSKKFETLMTRANFAPRSEVQALEARVKQLEDDLARLAPKSQESATQ
jgi:polyhydroxyalkanoate synthesis regulator phasin